MRLSLGAIILPMGFPGGASGEEPACQCRRHKRLRFHHGSGRSPGGVATYSSILMWRIPWTEESDGLQFMEWQRGGHS